MHAGAGDLDPHWMLQHEHVSQITLDYLIPIERLDVLEKLIGLCSGDGINIGRSNVRPVATTAPKRIIDSSIRNLIVDVYWLDRRRRQEMC